MSIEATTLRFPRCANCHQPIERVIVHVPYWRHRTRHPLGSVFCDPRGRSSPMPYRDETARPSEPQR